MLLSASSVSIDFAFSFVSFNVLGLMFILVTPDGCASALLSIAALPYQPHKRLLPLFS
jgi:hypothetical protein